MASIKTLAAAALLLFVAPAIDAGAQSSGAPTSMTQGPLAQSSLAQNSVAQGSVAQGSARLATRALGADASKNAVPAVAAPRSASGERVEVPAAEDKRTIVGTFWAPKASGGNIAPGVVLVHQPGGHRDDLTEVAVRLHKQGFAVLAIDLRTHGESVGADKPWHELADDERTRVWAFALRDLRGGAAWLQKQSGVHSSNVSLVGDRAGCTLVVRHATRDENVRAIVLLDPPREQLGFNLAKDIESLAGLPTLIAASKESQSNAQAIADESARANDGLKFIEIAIFKGVVMSPPTELDKNLTAQISKFLADKTMLKKAK